MYREQHLKMTTVATTVVKSFETLQVSKLVDSEHVLVIEMRRPSKKNAMNYPFWNDFPKCFPQSDDFGDIRAVVIVGEGSCFSAGLDTSDGRLQPPSSGDIARLAFRIRSQVKWMQEALNACDKCPVPVIAAVHGACIGAGVDLITACDIRYCSSDSIFSVREVQLGLAADVGTLQRFPRVVSNQSLARELAYTGDDFSAPDALRLGLVSRVIEGGSVDVRHAAFNLARRIAALSPVAIFGVKTNLRFAQEHKVSDGLDFVATWSSAALQSEDIKVAASARISKERPTFSKL